MFESVFTLSQAVAQGLAGHPSLGPSGAGALFLWAPLEGGLLLPNLPPLPPQDSDNPLLSLFQPEPGAGNVRVLTMVPTGDSLGTKPSPNQQEMTPQPGHPLGVRVFLLVLSPAQLTPQWGPRSQAQPRPLLHVPWTTPAGTGVTCLAPSADTHHEQQGSPNLGALAQKDGLHEKQGDGMGVGGLRAKAARKKRSNRG